MSLVKRKVIITYESYLLPTRSWTQAFSPSRGSLRGGTTAAGLEIEASREGTGRLKNKRPKHDPQLM